MLPDLSGSGEFPDEVWWYSQELGRERSKMPVGERRRWSVTFEAFVAVERYHFEKRRFVDAAIDIDNQIFGSLEENKI